MTYDDNSVRIERVLDGVKYVTWPELRWRSCIGCVANQNSTLCEQFVRDNCPVKFIWIRKDTMDTTIPHLASLARDLAKDH